MATIVFDFFGVTFKRAYIIKDFLLPLTKKKKIKLNFEKMKKYSKLFVTNKITSEEYFAKGDLEDGKLVKEVGEYFFKTIKLNKDFHSVTNYLKKKYKLIVLSDIPEDALKLLKKKYKLNKVFSAIVTSCETGYEKTNPKIYKIVMKYVDDKNNVYFIDDRLRNLKLASQKFGWKTIWMKKKHENEPKFKPDFTITKLKDLKNIL